VHRRHSGYTARWRVAKAYADEKAQSCQCAYEKFKLPLKYRVICDKCGKKKKQKYMTLDEQIAALTQMHDDLNAAQLTSVQAQVETVQSAALPQPEINQAQDQIASQDAQNTAQVDQVQQVEPTVAQNVQPQQEMQVQPIADTVEVTHQAVQSQDVTQQETATEQPDQLMSTQTDAIKSDTTPDNQVVVAQ